MRYSFGRTLKYVLNAAAIFLPLLPATPHKAKMTVICGNFSLFLTKPHNPEQAGTYENFFLPALHGQPADLPNGRGNFFLFSLHGIILAIFQNAKNGRKKTGNLFLISCLGVPFYVTAVIQFFGMAWMIPPFSHMGGARFTVAFL